MPKRKHALPTLQSLSTGSIVIPDGYRSGKYDRVLDGGVWVARVGKVSTQIGHASLVRFRRRLWRRAWSRGLRLWWEWLGDGSLAVQAMERRSARDVASQPGLIL